MEATVEKPKNHVVDLLNKVAAIDPDAVSYQPLAKAMTSVKTDRDGLSAISFKTDAVTCTGLLKGTGRIGMIVWLDREAFNKATS